MKSLVAALLVAFPAAVSAQDVQNRPLSAADIQSWKGIRATALSNDGNWFAYQLAPNEGDAEVVLAQGGDAADRIAVSVAVTELPAVGKGDSADILVAVTEDRLRSEVKRGENRGRTLAHASVVRHITTVGEATADGPRSVRADLAIPVSAGWPAP